jgi:acetylornithine/succinyldiaminopimelate/putrescine aminotransferase/predicted amino acid dehydrogenase
MTGPEAYRNLVRPRLAELLQFLHLDVAFTRASGCHLWPDGGDRPVLDLVGGYGTLLFGHNHPDLVRAAVDFLHGGRPVHAQGSLRPLTGGLAARLGRGTYRVLFANSGAEAVEVALKHALLQRRGPVVALDGAFHGKTLGALQLTANPAFRSGFETGLEVLRVPPNDPAALRDVFRRHRPSALFLELIQGEGGVVPLTPEFVTLARALCSESALVVDECQTGLGRTGTFLACEHYGLRPDLVILSKALGGGIAKLSAVLVHADRWRPELSFLHTSTYADDDFSSAVALRVLDLLTEKALRTCAETGRWLKGRLTELAAEYPDVLRAVRGLGLLLGVELAAPRAGLLLPVVGPDLGFVVAGYLYHRHRVRTAPTLSSPLTLRVQPPVVTPRAELERFVLALRDVCDKLRSGDTPGLTRYFLAGPPPRSEEVRAGWAACCEDRPTTLPHVGWLFHLNDADDLLHAEPRFASLSPAERHDYLRHLEGRIVPAVVASTDVASRTGRRVRFDAVLLPLTARRIRELLDAGQARWLRALVQHAVDVAGERGCRLVSLGQYTSVIMRNGAAVRPGPVGVTTGNAYTAALALEAIGRAVPDLARRRAAVVGGAGNIGSAVARWLSGRCAGLTLVGRDTPASLARLRRLDLPGATVATGAADCRHADLVVVAVSSPTPVVRAEHLAPGAFVCDVSVPAGVDAGGRTDLTVVRGGVARLPRGEGFGIPGFPLARGEAFACMAEGLILALEGLTDRSFTGTITSAQVRRIAGLARKHGFGPAGDPTRTTPEVLHASA